MNITWHNSKVACVVRQNLIAQRPATVWLTGLSASGKSTIAFELERILLNAGRIMYVLDGDNVRHGLCRDLGFTEKDRHENIRRVAEVARLMNDAGLIVISAFISPYRADRESARQIIGAERFIETYLDAPLHVCEERDPKGLYRKARVGELANFTGIGAPYEVPPSPDICLQTGSLSPDQSIRCIIDYLVARNIITPL